MKQLISKMILMFAIAISFSADAQIYVRIRPPQPIIKVRPIAPSPRHVWVAGDWGYSGGRYNYRDGYWDRPTGRYSGWVEGHWRHGRRGWVWVPGHWR